MRKALAVGRSWIRRPGEGARDRDEMGASVRAAAHPALRLQTMVGNRAASRLLTGSGATGRQCSLLVGPDGGPTTPDVEASIARARGGRRGLERSRLRQMQDAFGADFGGVRIHADGQADRQSRPLAPLVPAGTSLQRSLLGQQRTKEDATKRHQEDRERLAQVVRHMTRSTDVRTANTGELCKSGSISLVAMTPVHNSDELVRARGEGEVAYFGQHEDDVLFGDQGKFNDKGHEYGELTDDDLEFGSKNEEGDQGETGVRIYGISDWNLADEDIETSLRHEAQHAVDWHKRGAFRLTTTPDVALPAGTKIPPEVKEALQEGLQTYMTELRAYGLQGRSGEMGVAGVSTIVVGGAKQPLDWSTDERLKKAVNPKEAKDVVQGHFQSKKALFPPVWSGEGPVEYTWRRPQWFVLRHLLTSPSYGRVSLAWLLDEAWHKAADRRLQQQINAFDNPLRSINPLNSPRLRQLAAAMQNATKLRTLDQDSWNHLQGMLDRLHPNEVRHVLRSDEWAPLRERMPQAWREQFVVYLRYLASKSALATMGDVSERRGRGVIL